jgi:hypothetical protein
MSIEIIINEITTFLPLNEEMNKTARTQPIKDIEPNSQLSIEGTWIQCYEFGQQKHLFCTIKDEDGEKSF